MLNKLQNLFELIAGKIENNPTPINRYYSFFFAILSVRLTLEFFSSKRLFSFADVMHIGLWFIFIVLAFLVQLQFFSKEKVSKTAKLVITCFTIALSAPILDLIISKGVGAKMNYLFLNSWKDVLWSYITVGGSSFSRGATMGIRIEIVLLIIACFNYVRTKRNSIWIGFASAWSVYTVLFLSGAIPFILSFIIRIFHLQYQNDDQSTLLLLLNLDLFLLFILLYRHSPTQMKRIFQGISWTSLAICTIQFIMGGILARKLYPDNWSLNPTSLFWFPLFLALIMSFGAYTSLQILDKERNKPLIFNALLFFIVLICIMISSRSLFVASFLWGILYLWREQPLYLAQVPILRNILASGVGIAAALVGFVSFGAPMIGFPTPWLVFLMFAGVSFSISSEIQTTTTDIIPWFHAWNTHKKTIYKIICTILLLAAAALSLVFQSIHYIYIILMFSIVFAIIFMLGIKNNSKIAFNLLVLVFYMLMICLI